jgi:hypothetical protein
LIAARARAWAAIACATARDDLTQVVSVDLRGAARRCIDRPLDET